MTRLTLLLTIMIPSLAAPSFAAPGPSTPKADTKGKSWGVADPVINQVELKKQIDDLCKQQALPVPQPIQPTDDSKTAAGVEDGKKIADESKLLFDSCSQSRGANGSAQSVCDRTYARILLSVHDGNVMLKKTLDGVCAKIKEIPGKCTDQSTADKCSGEIYKSAAEGFKEVSDWLGARAHELDKAQDVHAQVAEKEMNGDPKKKADPAAPKYVAKAKAKVTDEKSQRLMPKILKVCENNGQNKNKFCENIGAASDAGYFARKLLLESQKRSDTAKSYEAKGTTADNNGNNNSSITGGKGGMGLDDMIKLGTLGLMGATLYCSFNKQACSGGGSQQSSLTDPNANAGGATSPTPSSANNSGSSGPESSNLGNSSLGSGNATGGSSASTMPQTSAATLGFHNGGGGVSSSDPALAHFNGDLGSRAPASAAGGALGGGGSSGASMAGGSMGGSGPDSAAGASAPAKAAGGSDNGSGSFGGGGGLGSAGAGFSLGDSKNASATDAALKNILNGDSPTGTDTSLAPLDGATGTTAASDASDTDPESLFVRVRDTHVRCLKRGCVGQEVGNNI